MSDIKDWSTTAASNNSASPNGFPEGMAPAGVNDSAREVMASVREWYEAPEWRDWGHTVSYSSGTIFETAAGDGDTTGVYVVGRRVRAVGSLTGTIYGVITASAHTSVTAVTVSWDSGSLQSESLTVSVGPSPVGRASKGLTLQIAEDTLTTLVGLTTFIAFDDTIPQSSEGEEILSQAITPLRATSTLVCDVSVPVTAASGTLVVVALFEAGSADAKRVAYIDGGNQATISFSYQVAFGNTTARTFSVRVGQVNAGLCYINGSGGSRQFGGTMFSSLTIYEID